MYNEQSNFKTCVIYYNHIQLKFAYVEKYTHHHPILAYIQYIFIDFTRGFARAQRRLGTAHSQLNYFT